MFDFVSLLFGILKKKICFSFLFMYFFFLFLYCSCIQKIIFSALQCFRFCLGLQKKKHNKKNLFQFFVYVRYYKEKKNCFSFTGFYTAKKKKKTVSVLQVTQTFLQTLSLI